MPYRRRIVDDSLDELFPHLSAIALEGAKGVGKTATASQRATTVFNLSDPATRELVTAHLDSVVEARGPVLIDEWQHEPAVWDRVRRAVDDDATGGRFLLAGSAGVAPDVRIHSGAGRIVRTLMRPLSVAERGLLAPTVSMRALLTGAAEVTGSSAVTLPIYVEEILRSGLPGIRDLPERPRAAQLDSYLARIVDRELPEQGIRVRRPAALTAWLTAYAAATSTDASYSAVLDAATPGDSDKPARQTVDVYREHLQRMFILDPLPAWTPAFAPLNRLTRGPKHHLVDSALAARLIGVDSKGLLQPQGTGLRPRNETGTWLGALFESLVTQSVRVYAQASDATVGHLRTKSTEHEIDLIVERPDRSVVAVEVKLGGVIDDRDVRHLHWLKQLLGDRVRDLVVVNTGEHAYRRADGVAVIPLALLGP